ncbi:MAG: hypothetical protein GWP08_16185 [Nitrospiraceae bacterium]|nr:hypothetical protein [Nitrospiraceae bacterium]
MDLLRPPQLHHYPSASAIEWVEADGVGGIASSSVLGVNTRKQHGLLSVRHDNGRMVLVANLQETLVWEDRSLDLSTNAYFGTIHPRGYLSLESFTNDPWPTWRFVHGDVILEKQVLAVRGEDAVVVSYALLDGREPATLVVRPLLAFRDHNALRHEQEKFPNSWQATAEFIECRPFDTGPSLFIAHPNAKVSTIHMWYQGFVYDRDRELHLDCIEDLYHPGVLRMDLAPGSARSLVFSTPSPRSVELAPRYMAAEHKRRSQVVSLDGVQPGSLFESLLRAADAFVYEDEAGDTGILPALPWGTCETYRGLMAFAGLLLAPGRFDTARVYLTSLGRRWRAAPTAGAFSPEGESGQMHPADVPLFLFVAAWRFWRATRDDTFLHDELLPLLAEIAGHYEDGGEVYLTDDSLIELGHKPGEDYDPHLPLGTNVLWYNAQMLMAEMTVKGAPKTSAKWLARGEGTFASLQRLFTCEWRPGLADTVRLEPFERYETVRLSQVLSVGLPYCAVAGSRQVADYLREQLGTPYGPRSLSPGDASYRGDGRDVRTLPKDWSGSVDPAWFGVYCDALKRGSARIEFETLFAPFETELRLRCYGHVSGAFAGDGPHEGCDFVASAAAVGELMRIYAREVLRFAHVV